MKTFRNIIILGFFISMLLTKSGYADNLSIKNNSNDGEPSNSERVLTGYIWIDGKQVPTYETINQPGRRNPYREDPGGYISPDTSWHPYPKNHHPAQMPKTIIIKEVKEVTKEIIKEVPVKVEEQAKAPERKWIPPVYREILVKGHYITGITETRDDNGVRIFTDDATQQQWVPDKVIQVIVTPGYYE